MKVLAVLSHPDDELFCLGSLCMLGETGVELSAMFVTSGDGDRKVDGYLQPGEDRGAARERETRDAAGHWPVKELMFERLPDSRGDDQHHVHTGLADRLGSLLAEVPYDAVITHGSHGEYGHPCHIAVHQTVKHVITNTAPSLAMLTFNACDIGNRLPTQINPGDPAGIVVDVRRFRAARLAVLNSYASQRERFRPYIVHDDIDADLAEMLRLRDRETFAIAHAPADATVLDSLFGPAVSGRARVALNTVLCLCSRVSDIPVRLVARLNRHRAAIDKAGT